jgi:hypothetical protein
MVGFTLKLRSQSINNIPEIAGFEVVKDEAVKTSLADF